MKAMITGGALAGWGRTFCGMIVAISCSAPSESNLGSETKDADVVTDGHSADTEPATCPQAQDCDCCPVAFATFEVFSTTRLTGRHSYSPCGKRIAKCIWTISGLPVPDVGSCAVEMPGHATFGDVHLSVVDQDGLASCSFSAVPQVVALTASGVWHLESVCAANNPSCTDAGRIWLREIAPNCGQVLQLPSASPGDLPLVDTLTLEYGVALPPLPLSAATLSVMASPGLSLLKLTRATSTPRRIAVYWMASDEALASEPHSVKVSQAMESGFGIGKPIGTASSFSPVLPGGKAWLIGVLDTGNCLGQLQFSWCRRSGGILTLDEPAPHGEELCLF